MIRRKYISKSSLNRYICFGGSPHSVKSFEIVHKGDNTTAQYLVGTLDTKNGEYRTTIYMKQKGDKHLLQELRFEK